MNPLCIYRNTIEGKSFRINQYSPDFNHIFGEDNFSKLMPVFDLIVFDGF